MLEMLNLNELVAQTLSFTIVYQWRSSLIECVKGVAPPELIKGPLGEIVMGCLLTLLIIIIAYFYEEIMKKYKKKIGSSTKKDDDPDGPDGPDEIQNEFEDIDNELAMEEEVELDN